MKRITSALFIIIVFGTSVFSQRSESEIALKEYFADAEFFLAQEYYRDALNDFIQIYKRGYQDNYNINYKIGICYLNIPGQKDKAIEYLEKAKTGASLKYRESTLNEKLAPIDVHLYLGNAYRVNSRIQEAIAAYNEYKQVLPEDEVNLHQYANKQIEACNIANEFMSHPNEVNFVNMGERINNSSGDYKAVVSGDGTVLVYMRSLPFYEAIYFSRLENGEWTAPENITPQLMSDGDQFVSCLSYDGKTLYVSREDEFNSDIYVSRFADNHWSRSEPLNANINTKYWESHASVSKDGKILYFASNRKDGLGEMDIYRSTLTAVGSWGPAKNLGSGINTDLNEDTPFITADGQTLYFCGQGFANMGGYDIFRSARNPDGEWSVPENLGSPVNTPDDDLFYYPWNNGEVAYMARIMEEGYGEMDIYRITYMPKTDVTVASDEPIEEAAPVETQEISVEKPEVSVDSQTDVDEEVRPEEPVAAPRSATIVTLGLEPALFDFDRSTISVQGKTQLTKLADLMKEHNNVSVELTGYTDALGPEEYNLRLSEKRAQSARLYMISLGVEASRIKTAGKGETEFIAPNTNPDGSDNPEGRKYNRRVEFEVSGTDKEKLMIKRLNPVPEKHIQNLK